jgi:hypothetical protein
MATPSLGSWLLIGALVLSAGCAERRAERAFRRAIAMEETHPLPEVQTALRELIDRWPKTKAAAAARQEIEWVDDLLSAAQRGPLLRAWDAIRKVSIAVERFRHREGHAPDSQGELVPRDLSSPVLDPWGVPVRVSRRGSGYQVVSYGADGIPGGGGNDTDLVIENGKFVYGARR